MREVFVFIKVILTTVGTFFASMYGGWSAVLTLLVVLMLVDLVTGFSLAVINQEVSSRRMSVGIFRKFITFIMIFVGYYFDLALIECMGALPKLGGIVISIKVFMSVYFCFEETISVVENCANLGIPVPSWVRKLLCQVSDEINNSTPEEVIGMIRKCLSYFGKNRYNTSDYDDK